MKAGDGSHRLLGGAGRDGGFSHGLSSSQIKEMSAICEALIPPLPLHSVNKETPENQALLSFCKASGSQHPFPDEAISSPINLSSSFIFFLIYFSVYCLIKNSFFV